MFSSLAKPYIVFNFTACAVHLFFLKKIINYLSCCWKSSFLPGWSKTSGCKAREIKRNEAYCTVRRNDERWAQRSRWVFFSSLLMPAKKI